MKLKMISCIKCGEDMPELRLTQYGYKVCVNCSSVRTKRGIPVTKGSGDHTWTETVIMEEDQYESFVNSTAKERGSSGDTVTFKLN
jgi:hypothetical protein